MDLIQDPLRVTVKNTFLHFCGDDSEAPRRCRSAPDLLRPSGAASNKGPRTECWGEASTEAGLSEDDADSLTSSLPQARAALVAGAARGSEQAAAPPKAQAQEAQEAAGKGRQAGDSGTPPAAPREREASTVRAPTAADFLRQVAGVAAAIGAALVVSGCAAAARAAEGPCGWSVIVSLNSQDARLKQQALAVAKDTLLSHAVKAGCVFVMGRRTKPFVATPRGFAAVLCAMPDVRRACWGMFSRGCCRRGPECHWDHPAMLTVMEVVLEVSP